MERNRQQPVILVGVGSSGASHAALAWAAREARRRDAKLRVIQAWEPHPARALYAGSAEQQPATGTAAAQRLAADVISVLAGLPGAHPADFDLAIEVLEGPPERVLAQQSAQADILVLGSGGQSPVAQPDPLSADRPVGPVIRACLSHAHCPVVIINPRMTADPAADPPGNTRTGRPAAPAYS